MMSVSLGVSLAVFVLIAAREWLPAILKIWHIMVAGAVVLLALREISPADALAAIDWNIILYLFSVFSIGRALYDNGISHEIAGRMVGLKSRTWSLAAFVATLAVTAAILTNDAAAIIGAPIALVLAHRTGADPKLFLVALSVTVTIGSMATPIGNPQNLLIAASGELSAPVLTFFLWLIVPTVASLVLSTIWFARTMRGTESGDADALLEDPRREERPGHPLWPLYLAVALLVVLVVGESLASAIDPALSFPLGIAAGIACLPVYLFSPTRLRTLRHLDWPTLFFFVAMFIVTGALLESGSLQAMLGDARVHMNNPLVTAGISFLGSQVFSNVPLVDMYLKLLPSFEVDNLMMLAAVSTLAGNVFIISAASNVIVLQAAERFGGPVITFTRFTREVLPIGIVSTLITIVWILLADTLFG